MTKVKGKQRTDDPKIILRLANGEPWDLYPLLVNNRDWVLSIGKDLRKRIEKQEIRIAELERRLEANNGR